MKTRVICSRRALSLGEMIDAAPEVLSSEGHDILQQNPSWPLHKARNIKYYRLHAISSDFIYATK